ncbi:MAG: hypothetical protein QOJ99_5230 [Bryobacterales bacterium]|jgi:hypothetical protein|nr:hypothetical protein [Bryobacterales bacterium]
MTVNLRKEYFRFALLFLCSLCILRAQPTYNALSRTWRVQSPYGTGTIFSIDVDGREYWVTAAHILTGAKGKPYGRITDKTVELQLLNPGGAGVQWLPVKFSVLQPPNDVDIVVLVPTALLLDGSNNTSPPATSDGLLFGGPCEFMGYALGGGWRAKMGGGSFWMPFIKHCTISGTDSESRMWILDGINNPGFSGGPVFLGTGNDLKFAAVISGYYLEPTEVMKGNAAQLALNVPKDFVNVNSGFIIAYDISHAVDLVKKNPLGPKRPAK